MCGIQGLKNGLAAHTGRAAQDVNMRMPNLPLEERSPPRDGTGDFAERVRPSVIQEVGDDGPCETRGIKHREQPEDSKHGCRERHPHCEGLYLMEAHPSADRHREMESEVDVAGQEIDPGGHGLIGSKWSEGGLPGTIIGHQVSMKSPQCADEIHIDVDHQEQDLGKRPTILKRLEVYIQTADVDAINGDQRDVLQQRQAQPNVGVLEVLLDHSTKHLVGREGSLTTPRGREGERTILV